MATAGRHYAVENLFKDCATRHRATSQGNPAAADLNEKTYAEVWNALLQYVARRAERGKSIQIPLFGKIVFQRSQDTGDANGEASPPEDGAPPENRGTPRFILSENFAGAYGIYQKGVSTRAPTRTNAMEMNWISMQWASRVAAGASFNHYTLSAAMKDLFHQLGEVMGAGERVRIDMLVGVLECEACALDFTFSGRPESPDEAARMRRSPLVNRMTRPTSSGSPRQALPPVRASVAGSAMATARASQQEPLSKSWGEDEMAGVRSSLSTGPSQTKRLKYPPMLNAYSRTIAAPYGTDLTYHALSDKIGSLYSPFASEVTMDYVQKTAAGLPAGRPPRMRRVVSPDGGVAESIDFTNGMGSRMLSGSPPPAVPAGTGAPPAETPDTSSERYWYYIEHGIPDHVVSVMKEEWMEQVMDLIPQELSAVPQSLVEEMLAAMRSEVRSDYYNAVKKSIVDYVLKSPEERRRLNILTPPPPFEESMGRARAPKPPTEWRDSVAVARAEMATTLFVTSRKMLELLRIWESYGGALLVEPPERLRYKLPLELEKFKMRQQEACDKTKDALWNDWIPSAVEVFKDGGYKMELPQPGPDAPDGKLPEAVEKLLLEKYFGAVSTLMSNQVRTVVEASIAAYVEFFDAYAMAPDDTPAREAHLAAFFAADAIVSAANAEAAKAAEKGHKEGHKEAHKQEKEGHVERAHAAEKEKHDKAHPDKHKHEEKPHGDKPHGDKHEEKEHGHRGNRAASVASVATTAAEAAAAAAAAAQAAVPQGSFSGQTPVIVVRLQAEGQGIVYRPSFKEVETTVLAIFDRFVSAVAGIPRVESRLSGAVDRSKVVYLPVAQVSDQDVSEARNRVKAIVQDAAALPVRLLQYYDKYLYLLGGEGERAVREFLSAEHSLKEYAAEVGKYRRIAEDIVRLLPSEVPLDLVLVQCDALNKHLASKAQDLANRLLSQLCIENRQQCLQVCEAYESISAKVMRSVASPEETVEQQKYISAAKKKELARLGEEIAEIGHRLNFLLDFNFFFSEEDVRLNGTAFNWPRRIAPVLEESEARLGSERVKFEDALKRHRDKFVEEIKQICLSVDEFTEYGEIERLAEYCDKLLALQVQINNAHETMAYINTQEELFDWSRSFFMELENAKKALEPFEKLWTLAQEFDKAYYSWTEGPFKNLDAEAVERDVGEMYRSAYKLVKLFAEKPAPAAVAEHIKAKAEEFRVQVPLVQVLCNPGMRERHWESLSNIVGFQVRPDESANLNLMLKMKLDNHLPRLQELSDNAAKEYSLEKTYDKMQTEWQPIEFSVHPYRETGTHILSAVDDIQALLEDHIVKTQTMLGSPFIRPFEEKIKAWERTLTLIQDVLDAWLKCQASWLYLEPIFGSEDIMKQMPAEGKKFQAVDKMWRETMKQVTANPSALAVAQIRNLLPKLQEANSMLDVIQKGLNDYLETKRLYFPRFFFLSNDELLEILSETKDPLRVQPHLKKCFEGIASLEFKDGTDVIAMYSSEKERVALSGVIRPHEARGAVEKWLLQVEETMRKSIREMTERAVASYTNTPRAKWVLEWPGQVVLCGSQIFWTKEVAEAIREGGAQGLRAYQAKCTAQLEDIVALVRGELPNQSRITLGALVVIDVHARDVVGQLADDGLSDENDFEWTSQLRYYWEDGNVKVRMINATLNYGYEYLGNSGRLVITPLTDRCYRTLMGALHLNLGGAPEGPAGTGKTESTKDLAKAVAKQCVVFNCSDGLDYIAMGKFFKGLASAGAWACFDEFNRIDLEVLSVIAQQILTIQRAIAIKAERFTFKARRGIFHGTSYAAGVVAGVAALYREALPVSPPAIIEDVLLTSAIPAMRPSILNSSPNRLISVSGVLLPGATGTVGPAAYDPSLFSGSEIGMCSFTNFTTVGRPSALHRQLLKWGEAYFDAATVPSKAVAVLLVRLRVEQDYNRVEITIRNEAVRWPSLAIYIGNPAMPSYERRLYGWFQTDRYQNYRYGTSIRPGTYYAIVQGNSEKGNAAGPPPIAYQPPGENWNSFNLTGPFRLDAFDGAVCPYLDYAPDSWTNDGTCKYSKVDGCARILQISRGYTAQGLDSLLARSGLDLDPASTWRDFVIRLDVPVTGAMGYAERIVPDLGDAYGDMIARNGAVVLTDGCPTDPASTIVATKKWVDEWGWILYHSGYDQKILLSGSYYATYYLENAGSSTWGSWVMEWGVMSFPSFPRMVEYCTTGSDPSPTYSYCPAANVTAVSYCRKRNGTLFGRAGVAGGANPGAIFHLRNLGKQRINATFDVCNPKPDFTPTLSFYFGCPGTASSFLVKSVVGCSLNVTNDLYYSLMPNNPYYIVVEGAVSGSTNGSFTLAAADGQCAGPIAYEQVDPPAPTPSPSPFPKPSVPTCSAHFPDAASYIVLPPMTFGEPITFEFWMSLGEPQNTFTRVFDFADENSEVFVRFNAGLRTFVCFINDTKGNGQGFDYVGIMNTADFELNKWYHMVSVLGEGNDMRYYMTDENGVRTGRTPTREPLERVGYRLRTSNYIGTTSVGHGNPGPVTTLTLRNVRLSGLRFWPAALPETEARALATGASIGRQPIFYYPFDDNPGSGVARDASGNGHDGFIVGNVTTGCIKPPPPTPSPTPSPPKVPTCSAHFPGGESYITLPPMTFGEPVTFEFWINLGALQNTLTRVFDFAEDYSEVFVRFNAGSRLLVCFANDTKGTGQNFDYAGIMNAADLELNKWYHTVTVLGEGSDMRYYMTEGETGTRTGRIPTRELNERVGKVLRTSNFIGTTSVGHGNPGPVAALTLRNVRLSGFRIWPGALSETEARALATGASIGRQPIVHYPFDDRPGLGVARDASGNGLYGLIAGNVTTGCARASAKEAAGPSPQPTPTPSPSPSPSPSPTASPSPTSVLRPSPSPSPSLSPSPSATPTTSPSPSAPPAGPPSPSPSPPPGAIRLWLSAPATADECRASLQRSTPVTALAEIAGIADRQGGAAGAAVVAAASSGQLTVEELRCGSILARLAIAAPPSAANAVLEGVANLTRAGVLALDGRPVTRLFNVSFAGVAPAGPLAASLASGVELLAAVPTATPATTPGPSSSSVNVGGAVGGALGGAAALTVAVGAFLWYRRQKAQKEGANKAKAGGFDGIDAESIGPQAVPVTLPEVRLVMRPEQESSSGPGGNTTATGSGSGAGSGSGTGAGVVSSGSGSGSGSGAPARATSKGRGGGVPESPRPETPGGIAPPPAALLAAIQRPVALLGEGASGRVYAVAFAKSEATWLEQAAAGPSTDDGTLVRRAVKEVAVADGDVVQREMYGAGLQAMIVHENILPVEIIFRDPFRLYILLPLADLSLDAFIAMSGVLAAPMALDFGAQMAAGMQHLHHGMDPPVAHRDLKPQNVLLFRQGQRYVLRLCDFGISRHVDTAKTVRGTLVYLPPETFTSYIPIKADVWAFALICMEMFTGLKPHDGMLVGYKELVHGQPYPDSMFESVPLAVRRTLLACLSADPTARPDFREIHDAFQRAIASQVYV